MTVAVVCPVLGRPQRVRPFLDSLEAATPEPYSVLFVADSDDHEELEAIAQTQTAVIALDPPVTWAQKVNKGFQETTESFLFFVGDDVRFHPHWLSNAMKQMQPGIGVVGTNDLSNPRSMAGELATHFLVRRSYVEEQGVIDEPGKVVHEGYFLDYADDELTQTAMARGAYAHALDSVVEHLHPIVGDRPGKLPDDDTYRMARSRFMEGRNTYLSRCHLWAT